MLKFPSEFVEKYKKLTDFDAYSKTANKFLERSIRVNTLKISVEALKQRLKHWKLEQVPWCTEGFFISGERRDIGHLIEHQLGYIYVQEAASMLPSLVLNPKNEIILDACAAPGSKTTHLAAIMKNSGLIIANDKNFTRISPLSTNLQRCGVTNAVVTISDANHLKGKYKKILLDTPCSGSGKIRGDTKKSQKLINSLYSNYLKKIAGIQKQLLLHLYSLLEKGGILVYSTCSLEPEEDEEVIQYLLDKTDAELEKINLKIKSDSKLKNTLKLWPQFYDTEGFFIAKIKKP